MKSLVIEKYPTRLAAPKAHAINPRSLEICRQFRLDTKAIRRFGSPRSDAHWVNFVTNLSGQRIGRLPYERMDADVLKDTPEMIHNIPQPEFEQFIADHLVHDSNVEMRKGVGFISCTQKHSKVTTIVEERESKRRYSINSEYVVACDGAKSAVRKFLGVQCDGEDSYEAMMTIHINADLRPILGEHGVGMLHWIMDPAVSGFIIGYDLAGNQVLICNFDEQKHPAKSWTEAHARSVVIAALGRSDVPFDVLSFRPWILSRKVVRQYSVGNVFLCGDAAHAFPPTGGLGLNCGLADVHNLAYKLAANLQGWGGRSLLDSYSLERRHIAELYSQQSVKNGKKIFGFLKTLGLAGIDDVEQARSNLLRKVNEPEMQVSIADGVEGQREHFDNLELHIGYVYGRQGLYQPPHASIFQAKYVSGARLAHAWISPRAHLLERRLRPIDVSYVWEFDQSQVATRRFSTLDLVPSDGFALIVGARREWSDRSASVQRRLRLRGVRFELFVANGVDFDFSVPSEGAIFAERAGLLDGDGMLVRPDQHILSTVDAKAESDEITNAILEHLGL